MGGKSSKSSSFSSRDRQTSSIKRQFSSSTKSIKRYESGKYLSRQYSYVGDDYKSVGQMIEALRNAGLESSNLIVGIDFTKSNEWTGKECFRGRSLHVVNTTSICSNVVIASPPQSSWLLKASKIGLDSADDKDNTKWNQAD